MERQRRKSIQVFEASSNQMKGTSVSGSQVMSRVDQDKTHTTSIYRDLTRVGLVGMTKRGRRGRDLNEMKPGGREYDHKDTQG